MLCKMEKISVQLYGGKGIFGGRETPLEAEIIYCDRADQCSFHKEGKCLQHRAMFSPGCKFGKSEVVKGYTSRAAKYYDFKKKWQNDPLYGKLEFPNKLVAVMGDHLFINSGMVCVRKRRDDDEKWRKDVNGYIIQDTGFGTSYLFLPLEDATNDLLKEMFSFYPRSLMGDSLNKDWKEKRAPQILQDLKGCAPDIYQRFTTEFPEYIYEPDYIGKAIYIDSLKPGTHFTHKGVTWIYDGEYVCSKKEISIGLVSPWWSEGSSQSMVKIKVNDKMTVKVESNDIVDENTRFV